MRNRGSSVTGPPSGEQPIPGEHPFLLRTYPELVANELHVTKNKTRLSLCLFLLVFRRCLLRSARLRKPRGQVQLVVVGGCLAGEILVGLE